MIERLYQFLEMSNGCQKNSLKWAMIKMRLGNAYCSSKTNRLENLTRGFKCYEESLKVCQKDTNPTEWAEIQQNLGTAYYVKGMLGHSESSQNIEKAIECIKNALEVYNCDRDPQKWAQLQHDLGVCYSDRRLENIAENLELAIRHLQKLAKYFYHLTSTKYSNQT